MTGGTHADLNDDGVVDGADLSLLLADWATPFRDLNADGTTDGADLGILLGEWKKVRHDSGDKRYYSVRSGPWASSFGSSYSRYLVDGGREGYVDVQRTTEPILVLGKFRMSTDADIIIPVGSEVHDAETVGGPLWRDIILYVFPRQDYEPYVCVYEVPYGWWPSDIDRANVIKGITW